MIRRTLHNLINRHTTVKKPLVGEIGVCHNRITGSTCIGVKLYGGELFELTEWTASGVAALTATETAADFEAVARTLGAVPA